MHAVTPVQKRQELRRLLQSGKINIAPGAADVLTARFVAQMGFPAVYLSGSLQHAMRGYADINALTMSEMVKNAENVADEIAIPCIADAETGFGIGVNVTRTVRSFERAGVAAIHIEDSTVPKRPARLGFESPTVSKAEFLDKIKAAVDARADQDMVIIARSELRDNDDDKVERLQGALDLGADAFWAGGFSPPQVTRICRDLQKPAVAVLPQKLSAEQFGALGVRLAVVPGALAIAGLLGQRALLEEMKTSGSWFSWLERQPDAKAVMDYYNSQGLSDVRGEQK
jgi:2-methylisocitrate lyase-like PEP mutase family enzyme